MVATLRSCGWPSFATPGWPGSLVTRPSTGYGWPCWPSVRLIRSPSSGWPPTKEWTPDDTPISDNTATVMVREATPTCLRSVKAVGKILWIFLAGIAAEFSSRIVKIGFTGMTWTRTWIAITLKTLKDLHSLEAAMELFKIMSPYWNRVIRKSTNSSISYLL